MTGSLSILMTFMSGLPAATAAPCTLYKAQDIANAKENIRRYAWAKAILKSWENSAQFALKQNRAFFDNMVSELTNWTEYGQNCPACVGKKSAMGECFIYNWNVTDPDKVTCKYCGTVYPNAAYPETGAVVCPKMGQTFTYYQNDEERAHPGENPSKYAYRWASWPVHTSFTGVIRSKKSHWCAERILPLAKLYALTGDVKYAERCVWILDRFAHCYPNWLYHSYNGTVADCPPAEAAANMGQHGGGGKFPKDVIIDPFERHQKADHATLCNGFWGAGRFDCSGCDPYLLHMTVAYDLVREATYPDGRRVLDAESEKRIVNDLLLAGCTDTENWKDINNKCGPSRAVSAACGILFERPQSVRRALEGFEKLLEDCFHFDGFCKESPSYSDMHLGLMQNIPEILRGYSDPAGYQPPDGKVFRDLNPFESVVRYRLALESMARMVAPDRTYPVIGDTHAGGRIHASYAEILTDRYSPSYAGLLETAQGAPLAEKGGEYALWYRNPNLRAEPGTKLPLRTEWFPGWHVSVMRNGAPHGDTALYLNAYEYHGHRHMDTLGLIYCAFGKELASDRGYIWDDVTRQNWTTSTLAHNLVTVDGVNQNTKPRGSVLQFFGATPGVEVTQARANAYTQCDLYRRTCVLVRLPDGGSYAVDVFEVNGGKRHQYGFQCNGNLVTVTGPAPQPVADQIKWLTNLRASQPTEPVTATWHLDNLKMDLTVLSPIHRLLVADAPGWRSEKGTELNAPPIQQVFAERTFDAAGGEKLHSDYVAVMVPYKDASPVRTTRLLAADGATGGWGVAVELTDRTDYVLMAPDAAQRQFGPVTLAGRFGFVSVATDGKVLQAYLLAGTQLRFGDTSISLAAATTTLKVAGIEGRTFRLAEPLPANTALPGTYVLAADTGWEIESADAQSITVRDYPVVPCEQLTLLHAAYVDRESGTETWPDSHR